MRKNEEKYANVEEPEATAEEIALSGIKIQDMSAKRYVSSPSPSCFVRLMGRMSVSRINNYTFKWDRVLSFEGDTGPYLQYAHVRISSITRKNPELLPLPPPSEIKTELLTEPQCRDIIYLLGTYPHVVQMTLKKHEPSEVVTFAFRLAHAIMAAWQPILVKGIDDTEKAQARMWMYLCARDVLGQAMRLLTLKPLERM